MAARENSTSWGCVGPSSGQQNTRFVSLAKICCYYCVQIMLTLSALTSEIATNSWGGGAKPPRPGNQLRSLVRPYVAKSYFETYKSYHHMQNFRPLSQKFSEISRIEKIEFRRFRLTLTHRNCHNSLNF